MPQHTAARLSHFAVRGYLNRLHAHALTLERLGRWRGAMGRAVVEHAGRETFDEGREQSALDGCVVERFGRVVEVPRAQRRR